MAKALRECLTASPWLIRAYHQHMSAGTESTSSTVHVLDLYIIIVLCTIEITIGLLKRSVENVGVIVQRHADWWNCPHYLFRQALLKSAYNSALLALLTLGWPRNRQVDTPPLLYQGRPSQLASGELGIMYFLIAQIVFSSSSPGCLLHAPSLATSSVRPEALPIGPPFLACKANSKCRYITRNQKGTAPLTQRMREPIRVKNDDLSMLPLLPPTNMLLIFSPGVCEKTGGNRLTDYPDNAEE